ncbi:substrate-binding domain-containing protein [Nonomuraea sp. B19D2]|uniref:LacI family DNA-binding transcriptional regulator n=1 Tax=Nonomuraea sp. B19D2 TaxID=3159561 RepID=UPI0032D9C427
MPGPGGGSGGPVMIVLGAGGEFKAATPAAREWLQAWQAARSGWLGIALQAVAATLSGSVTHTACARMRDLSGAWVALRAAPLMDLDSPAERVRPTAIFTANDMQALGVYQAARELGLSIPRDLSVVGFDDVPVVAWVDPPLTTVHQPLSEMADAATELALAIGRGEPVPQVGLEIATTLTVRESTAPPRD